MRARTIALVCALGLGCAACGDRDAPEPAQSARSHENPNVDWRAAFAGEPSDTQPMADGLVVRIYKTGARHVPQAKKGDTVTIEFIARYVTKDGTKTEFDSSAKRGGPLVVPLTEQSAVVGLLRGLEGLGPEAIARIEIPSTLGYGTNGRGTIPGDAGLEFDVWVREIDRGAATP